VYRYCRLWVLPSTHHAPVQKNVPSTCYGNLIVYSPFLSKFGPSKYRTCCCSQRQYKIITKTLISYRARQVQRRRERDPCARPSLTRTARGHAVQPPPWPQEDEGGDRGRRVRRCEREGRVLFVILSQHFVNERRSPKYGSNAKTPNTVSRRETPVHMMVPCTLSTQASTQHPEPYTLNPKP